MVSQSLLEDFAQTMPKKLLQVKKFEGGLNNNSSPTDLADNELQKASCAIVSKTGKIVLMGDMKSAPSDDPPNQALTFPPGRNLFSYESDKDGSGDARFTALGAKNYVTTSNTNGVDIKHWDQHDDWVAVATVGTADPEFEFSFYDGVLRYADGTLNNARGWWGFISRTHFKNSAGAALTPDSGGGAAAVTFPAANYSYAADLAAPARVLVGKMSGNSTGGTSTTVLTTTDGNFAEINAEIAAGYDADTDYVMINTTDNQYSTAISSTSAAMTGTALSGSADWDTTGGAIDAYEIYPPPGGIVIDASTTTTGGAIPDGTYKFGASFVYDDGGVQESNITEAGGQIATSGTGDDNIIDNIKIKFHSAALADPAYNRRITGARIYLRDTVDKSKTWHLVCDVNLAEGWRFSLDDDFEGGFAIQLAADASALLAGYRDLIYIAIDDYTSLSATTYSTINTFRPTDPIDINYRTSTTVNGVVYAGCIKQDGVIFPDRMIKCATTRLGIAYDVFPQSNFIDIATNDGDEIVVLESFADKVLQFKKRTLFIVNYSEDVGDYIEREYAGMGITHPAHVFKTPHGVAFINKAGCFLYNGTDLVNLTAKIDDKFDGTQSVAYSNYESTGNFFNRPTADIIASQPHGVGYSMVIGDTDGDGMLSEEDADMIVQGVVGNISLTEWQRYRSDTDGNMFINAMDATQVSRVVAGNQLPETLNSGFQIPLEDE